jgi:flagellar motor switch protein FliN
VTSQHAPTPPWVREIKAALDANTQDFNVPNLPSFPWKNLEHNILACFNLTTCQVSLKEVSAFKEKPLPILEGNSHLFLSLKLAPLNEEMLFVFSHKDLNNLTKLLAGSQEDLSFADPELGTAFQYFLFANLISCLEKTNYVDSLSYSFSLSQELPVLDDQSIALELTFQFNDLIIYPYAFVSPKLKQTLKQFLVNAPSQTISENLAANTSVDVKVDVGKVELDQDKIKGLKQGDFVILDSCSYHPHKDKGRAVLSVNGKPIFRALFGKDHVKLLEYPIFQEVKAGMDNENQENENFNLEDELLPSLEDELPLQEEATEISEEELQKASLETASFQEESEEQPAAELAPVEEEQEASPIEEAPPEPLNAHAPLVKAEDIPITLHVEVSTLKMTLKDLMVLQPGSTLELDVLPEQGVSLVNNGKAVARGQLIQVGDVLGVKILELKN